MKALKLAVLTPIVLSLATQLAASPLVSYEGTEAGGNGTRDYTYVLQADKEPILELRVTTNDLDQKHYTDVLTPDGWYFAIETGGPLHSGGRCTPIGEISPGPVRMVSIGQVRWWTDDPKLAVDSFTFGFNHPWYAQDVGWNCHSEENTFTEDWEAPVGEGAGPVHGVYSAIPEPATMSLLAIAALVLTCLRRKQS
ncbi:MAG: PEP-CTERM sorting domain-containing protein [Acidobacteriia bacterium]|nr:PEP-CTERM sorting domain-containing protein [Terriglobia bacterium]